MKMKVGELKLDDRLLALRSVDAFTVSRYRISMRAGAEFPPVVIDQENHVVSGNHRVTAYMDEFGEEYAVAVKRETFDTEADRVERFARENIANGRPMDRWTCRKIALELTAAGRTMQEVASLLNVPVRHLERWGERTVVVRGKRSQPKPIKGGITVPEGKMTAKQYEHHAKHDGGYTVAWMAAQLAWRLEEGFANLQDEKEVEALERVRDAVCATLDGVTA